VISEINYNPADPTANALAIGPQLSTGRLEVSEVPDAANQTQSLDGWQITGGIDFAFDDGITLAADSSILVVPFNPSSPSNAPRTQAFREQYGIHAGMTLVGGYQGNLSNSNDIIRLRKPNQRAGQPTSSTVVDEVHYDDRSPWPNDADGSGHSIQRTSAISNGIFSTSWRSAIPTPGSPHYLAFVPGDLTGGGVVNSRDIDRLFDAVQNRSDLLTFDINGDQAVDNADVDFLLNDILQSPVGDSNLDGFFDSTDLVMIFQAAEYEDDLVGNSTWAEGDWNGDGDFTTADFVAAFRSGKYRRN